MRMIKKFLSRVCQKISDERGATAIEYGMIAAAISVSIMVILSSMGTDIQGTFLSISDSLQ